jgi:uncharacterized protein YxjI
MNFPLDFTFQVVAFAPQFSVTDASGAELCYVRQKAFNLREHIQVFKDSSQTQLLSQIQADRIIDFSATYRFSDPEGLTFGSVKRKGMRSLWSSHYDVQDNGQDTYTIKEDNPWVKVLDSLIGEIPILNMFTGYFLNPKYNVMNKQGQTCYVLSKQASFFGRRFKLEQRQATNDDLLIVMSLIMMILLERRRG